jgi:hypothetical protein
VRVAISKRGKGEKKNSESSLGRGKTIMIIIFLTAKTRKFTVKIKAGREAEL